MLLKSYWCFLTTLAIVICPSILWAHGVDAGTQSFLTENIGVNFWPYVYIGAKHMVTGYDHILFLVGVIFFLFKLRDILLYVTLFTLGHTITLLSGVLLDLQVNAYIIDAIIGFSIVYKGFDNLGGFKTCFGFQPNTKYAVLIFGLFHGLGLATKIQEFDIPQDGLFQNIMAFNLGVEVGQIIALSAVLLLLTLWRKHQSYLSLANVSNTLLMSGGMMLMGLQIAGYILN